MISRNKKHELSGLVEVSVLWWKWDVLYKHLVLFIDSESLGSHIKCLKLRQLNLTTTSCVTNNINNKVNLFGESICIVSQTTLIMVCLAIYSCLISAYSNHNYKVCKGEHKLAVFTQYQSIFFKNEGYCVTFYGAPLLWVAKNYAVSWRGYFFWKLRSSPNLGLDS